jgi:branched-chain amino acid transport system substrate-binding protein
MAFSPLSGRRQFINSNIKKEDVMKKGLLFIVVCIFMLSSITGGQALAEVKKYTVPVISDFSGSWAQLFKAWVPMQKAVFAWWNDTEGKKLGVELELKHYDGRYDSSVIASMWPGILTECKPIIALGGGGADVAALQQRLPKDKVPVIYGTASYGYGWLPDQWIFQVRPLYVQEWMAAIMWYIQQHPEKKPLKIAFLSCQIAAALDLVKGVDKYVTEVLEPKGIAKIVAKEYTDTNPVDVSSQVKKIIDARADLVLGVVTPAMSSAYIRACQLYGVNIPTIGSPHHTIWKFGSAMKTFKPFEGHLVVAAHAPVTEKNSKAYEFFKLLNKKYGLNENLWNPYTMMALNQSILAVRAVEHAIKKVGAANLTGQAVYEALLSGPFTEEELMGTLPTLQFTREAPFCNTDLKVRIETVKDGEYTVATPEWIPVPKDIKKW